jgi:hypothetical protein
MNRNNLVLLFIVFYVFLFIGIVNGSQRGRNGNGMRGGNRYSSNVGDSANKPKDEVAVNNANDNGVGIGEDLSMNNNRAADNDEMRSKVLDTTAAAVFNSSKAPPTLNLSIILTITQDNVGYLRNCLSALYRVLDSSSLVKRDSMELIVLEIGTPSTMSVHYARKDTILLAMKQYQQQPDGLVRLLENRYDKGDTA